MCITAAPMWMASPPAMMATGISTRPLGMMPVSAIDHEDCDAAKPRRNPGRNVSRKPERGDEQRGTTPPQKPQDAWPALEARAQRVGSSLHRPAQPRIAREQRLAREALEAHAQEDRG